VCARYLHHYSAKHYRRRALERRCISRSRQSDGLGTDGFAARQAQPQRDDPFADKGNGRRRNWVRGSARSPDRYVPAVPRLELPLPLAPEPWLKGWRPTTVPPLDAASYNLDQAGRRKNLRREPVAQALCVKRARLGSFYLRISTDHLPRAGRNSSAAGLEQTRQGSQPSAI
jgi:hypothetical protein